jgi:hypothetical protein
MTACSLAIAPVSVSVSISQSPATNFRQMCSAVIHDAETGRTMQMKPSD